MVLNSSHQHVSLSRPCLSVALITLNEERRLEACLKSVGFADEIVVCDTGSTDNTVGLAKKLGAKVVQIPFEGFGKAKQVSLEQTSGEWILSLDADEIVSRKLAESILQAVQTPGEADGFILTRRAWFLGKPVRHGGWGQEKLVRLIRSGKARFDDSDIHEKLIVDGTVGTLHGVLQHHTDATFAHYLLKLDRYTTLTAQDTVNAGKSSGVFTAFSHALATFIKMYCLKQGWRDGLRGALLAGSSAYSTFLRYIKAALIARGEGAVLTASKLAETYPEEADSGKDNVS